MTAQLKEDIKTIVSLLVYLATYLFFGLFVGNHPIIYTVFLVISLSAYVYERYSRKWKSSIIMFPTVNDPAESPMPHIAAIGFISIAGISYLALHANEYFCCILVGMSLLSYLMRFVGKPSGWLKIERHKLRLIGVADTFDTRYVKEIVLKNEKIKITTLNGESYYSFVARLTPEISAKLKQFLDVKLSNGVTTVINEVSEIV